MITQIAFYNTNAPLGEVKAGCVVHRHITENCSEPYDEYGHITHFSSNSDDQLVIVYRNQYGYIKTKLPEELNFLS